MTISLPTSYNAPVACPPYCCSILSATDSLGLFLQTERLPQLRQHSLGPAVEAKFDGCKFKGHAG